MVSGAARKCGRKVVVLPLFRTSRDHSAGTSLFTSPPQFKWDGEQLALFLADAAKRGSLAAVIGVDADRFRTARPAIALGLKSRIAVDFDPSDRT